MKIWKCVVITLLIVMVAGCAINNKTFGTRNENFSEGKKLIEQGQFEQGLQKLQQASQEEPENREIQIELMRSGDEVATKLLFWRITIDFLANYKKQNKLTPGY